MRAAKRVRTGNRRGPPAFAPVILLAGVSWSGIKECGANSEKDEHERIQEYRIIPGMPKINREQIHRDAVEGDALQKRVVNPKDEAGEHGNKEKQQVADNSDDGSADPAQPPD